MEDMLRLADGTELHGYGHYHETYATTATAGASPRPAPDAAPDGLHVGFGAGLTALAVVAALRRVAC